MKRKHMSASLGEAIAGFNTPVMEQVVTVPRAAPDIALWGIDVWRLIASFLIQGRDAVALAGTCRSVRHAIYDHAPLWMHYFRQRYNIQWDWIPRTPQMFIRVESWRTMTEGCFLSDRIAQEYVAYVWDYCIRYKIYRHTVHKMDPEASPMDIMEATVRKVFYAKSSPKTEVLIHTRKPMAVKWVIGVPVQGDGNTCVTYKSIIHMTYQNMLVYPNNFMIFEDMDTMKNMSGFELIVLKWGIKANIRQ